MYIIADGQRLTKNGSRFNDFSGGTCLVDVSAAENSKLPTTDNSLGVGRTYELSRPLLAQLTPNTWYKYTDAAGKQEILKTDEDGYLYKHDRLSNLLDAKGYESGKYSLGNAIRFTIGKDGKGYLGDNKDQATKPDSQDPVHKKMIISQTIMVKSQVIREIKVVLVMMLQLLLQMLIKETHQVIVSHLKKYQVRVRKHQISQIKNQTSQLQHLNQKLKPQLN
ncbi:hypothetical protein FC57_GL001971 [Lactobacillus ultunensis DSM 16047]|uniref:Uncharacterized protein n=2 Tax=Lactobacillus ultunensis TaxID=227945 RepID=C2EQH4_9LACO|nr:hypothetical protein HMPREF0548_1920 [Lactobacillus ultunensis DSM 16047]KRL82275.1 hypothetical protein FC57_GL001971 [Lactobacillus ultunensis DSM 16047]